MKDMLTIEQQLIAAGAMKGANEQFVAHTMEGIRTANAGNLYDMALAAHDKPSPWQRFKHLPRLAMIALAFGACALVSSTAYAAYALWLSPSAQVRSVENKYGRDQALVDLKNCSGSTSKVTVEITKGSNGTPQGAADTELARCELQAIQSWAIQTFHAQPSDTSFPLSVTKVTRDTLTVAIPGPTKTTERSYRIDGGVPVIYQGKAVPLSTLHAGDAVALIKTARLNAVVKLSLPIKYYASDEVNNDYHDRDTCYGNAPASCINLPSLDVLRDGEAGANPDYHPSENYEIQGKLVSYTPEDFILEATDGTRYTVHTHSDVIGIFNTGNPYDSEAQVSIAPGDVLMVTYNQPPGGDPKDIQPMQYHEIQLMLQNFSKRATNAQSMQKYRY